MSDDAATAEQPAAAPPAPAEDTAKRKTRERRPLDPEARDALNRRQATNRLLTRVKAAKDDEKRAQLLEEALAKMGRPRTLREDPPPATPAPASSAAAPAPAEPLEPGQRPGWPKPSVVARFEPVLLDAFGQLRTMLGGTIPGALLEPRTGKARDQKTGELVDVTVDPCAALAQAWAPVAAQYIPEDATTPLATALVVTASLIGLPAMGMAFAWMRHKLAEKAAAAQANGAPATRPAAPLQAVRQ